MDNFKNQLLNMIYYLGKGVKGCYKEYVSNDYIPIIKDICKQENIYYLIFEEEENFATVYLYRYMFMTDIINYVETTDNLPENVSEYIIGKLLNYSDEAMEKYLTTWFTDDIQIEGNEMPNYKMLMYADNLLLNMPKDKEHNQLRQIINKLTYNNDYKAFYDEQLSKDTKCLTDTIDKCYDEQEEMQHKIYEQSEEIEMLRTEIEHWKNIVLSQHLHH